jgi:hypothetical protein
MPRQARLDIRGLVHGIEGRKDSAFLKLVRYIYLNPYGLVLLRP